jgi:peptidyl-prolyl cis-trans isomerase C
MSNKNLSKNEKTGPKAGSGKISRYLWPYGAVIFLICAIIAVLVYLAIQTYSPEKTQKETAPSQVAAKGTDQVPDTPVAIANGHPISKRNYEEMLAMSQSQQPNAGEGQENEPSMDLKLELLNSLVTMSVAVQEAYNLGFGPSELEVESAINQMVGEYGTREAFENALPAFGTNLETLRKQVADNLALRSWRDTAFIKQALATEEEAKAFYDEHITEATHDEQVRAVRIMLPVPLTSGQEDSQAKERVKAKADAIYQEALAGVNFDELVERNMDPATRAAVQGGQMGWVSRGDLGFDELEEVLFSLEPGQVGGPVESQFSYHIVKVIEKRPAGVISFEELRPEILEYLLSVKTERLFLESLRELRNKAKVEVLDKDMAAAWPAFQEKLNSQTLPGAPSEDSQESSELAISEPALEETGPERPMNDPSAAGPQSEQATDTEASPAPESVGQD